MARRGAGEVTRGREGADDRRSPPRRQPGQTPRRDAARSPDRPSPDRRVPDRRVPDRWVEETVPTPPQPPRPPRPRRPRGQRALPPDVARQLTEAVGATGVARAEKRLVDAAAAFDDDRPGDALRILRPLVSRAPEVAAVRELAGLSLYRLGRWKEAAAHLEAFVRLTGSVERHPVLADCYRALGRYGRTSELWEELGRASPSASIVTEGRIVAAGALADQGELRRAIALLERGPVRPRRAPAEHHLRLWYALADLYERVGDTPSARELFGRIAAIDPGMADVAERLSALG